MAGSTIVTGAHVVVYINGSVFGKVTSFGFKSVTARKEIRQVDSVGVQELAPTTTSVSCTMSLYRQMSDGGLEGAGITARYENLPRERYFNVTLVDRVTDSVIFQASQCSVEEQSWTIAPKGLVTGQVAFKALEWSNEVQSSTR
jgi:hypothetical protein